MKRNLIYGSIVIVAAASGGWGWNASRRPAPVEWQGYAEADFIKVGPTQQGLLTGLRAARGDRVCAGYALFDQDDASDRAGRDQAQRQLDQAERQLANLQAPARTTEIAQSEASLADAQATSARLRADLLREEKLVPSGAVSAQACDQTRADLLSAEAKVRGQQAALAQMHASTGREHEITAQLAAVEASRAALAMADWRLNQRHVSAPVAGVVADVLARPGETLAAGAPVVSLLPPGNIFVRFFVPEPMLARVHHGDQVLLTCDNGPTDFVATVSFIAPQSEYTPPVIYSGETRAKLVYMVEARPRADQAAQLNPGQPVTVRPIGTADSQ
jgi:HlyD family secretion protein